MKFALAVLAVVSAVAPPRISLQLNDEAPRFFDHTDGNDALHGGQVYREHDLGLTNVDHAHYNSKKINDNKRTKRVAVKSRQDWTEKCEAGADTRATCPFPKAQAFDYVDRKLAVTTRIFMVDQQGKVLIEPVPIKESAISFKTRATYLFKYDASDMAGNHAEQVVFALIVDDKNAPKFRFKHPERNMVTPDPHDNDITGNCWNFNKVGGRYCDPNTEDCVMNVEASMHPTWGLFSCTGPEGVTAFDDVDRYVSKTIRYTIRKGGKIVKSEVSAEEATEYFADWESVGNFQLTLSAHDNAGVYGSHSKNNVRKVTIKVVVADTKPPVIFIHGEKKPTFECGLQYQRCNAKQFEDMFHSTTAEQQYRCDMGAGAYDELDGKVAQKDIKWECKGAKWGPCTWWKNRYGKDVGTFKIRYSSTDVTSALTGSAIRSVKITDTAAPKVVLAGNDVVIAHEGAMTTCKDVWNKKRSEKHSVCAHAAGAQFYDSGVQVKDTCDIKLNARSNFSGKSGIYAGSECPAEDKWCWNGKAFNDRKVGKYVRTYRIKDASGNVGKAHRTFHVVDMAAPVVSLIGNSVETFEASRDVEYTDQGAKCNDYVDGDISHNVEVSGEIVNMKIPGTYKLQYDCQDNNGNMAQRMFRSIVIEDTSCPYVKLSGDTQVYVEAGFPYKDAGATATDTLDGDITGRVRQVGNTVDTAEAFYYAKSCAEIKALAKNPDFKKPFDGKTGRTAVEVNSGSYYVTTQTKFKKEAVVVTCNMQSGTTFFALDAVSHTDYSHSAATLEDGKFAARYPKCEDYGFIPFTNGARKEDKEFARLMFPKFDFAPNQPSDRRLCTKAKKDSWSGRKTLSAPQLRAEVGKYVIHYFVHDIADNQQCKNTWVSRTVTVKDTLAPVLSLKYKGKVLTASKPNHKNPAWNKVGEYKAMSTYGNAQLGLMAETTATNGWFIAAVASGIAGVALFGFSLKKNTNTPVPV